MGRIVTDPAGDEVRSVVLEFFRGDAEKADLWFRTGNPLLGGPSPDEMIAAGRHDRLLAAVKAWVSENRPAE